MSARWVLQHQETASPTYLHRTSRPQRGRMAWQGWFMAKWTLDPEAAKAWTTQEGAQAFATRHSLPAAPVEVAP